ncbi:YdeI/OmpD-associated family protein [Pendulispora albinea]|uniref:YdeI/OmpD-associated family protein n=1 Tax=Pendulispora albinea TaxID=2741071 RepID=A0ABZ2LJ92_9BACT
MSRLQRDVHPMPLFIKKELAGRGLMPAYRSRPAYQQNDYIGWITRAKLEATRQKRLAQMLDELDLGNVYMNMAWRPRG